MTYNPYIQQCMDQDGSTEWDVRESMKAPKERKFPCVIHGHYFASKEQYDSELHEFLMGI